MNKGNKGILFLIFSLVFLLWVNSFASGSLKDLTPAQKNYVARYVQAINSKNKQQLKELMHPSYLNCMNNSNQDYYEDIIQRTLKYNIPDNYEVSVEVLSGDAIIKEEDAILKGVEGAKQGDLSYPIKPTHQLQIDFSTGKYSSTTIVRKLVQEGDNFYEVSVCPSMAMIEKFREMKIKKAAEQLRAKKLFQELKDPLLSELTKLIKEGKKIDAWKKYSEVTGEILATAKEVLSYIELDNN